MKPIQQPAPSQADQTYVNHARQMARQLNINSLRDGSWFLQVVRQVVQNYPYDERRQFLQSNYGHLSRAEAADQRIRMITNKSAIAGATVGITMTSNQFASVSSFGIAALLLASSVVVELVYVAWLQTELVLDLSILYGADIDADNTDLMIRIFNYALGSNPKSETISNRESQEAAIKAALIRGGIDVSQEVAEYLGLILLKQTVVKYAVPVASVALGAGYNYHTTYTIGKAAKGYFWQLSDQPR